MTDYKTGNPQPPGYQAPLGLGYGFSTEYSSPQGSGHPAPPSYSSLQNQGQTNSSTLIWSSNVVAPAPMSMNSMEPPPPDYTARALIVMLCCCMPLGLCAVMKASESKRALARGDMQTARTHADSARQLTIMGLVAGIGTMIVSAAIMAVYFVLILSSMNTDD
ncbi:proline-rich transmembrane protein 1-like [Crassostrea virginica]